jgi:hypothetical protein
MRIKIRLRQRQKRIPFGRDKQKSRNRSGFPGMTSKQQATAKTTMEILSREAAENDGRGGESRTDE